MTTSWIWLNGAPAVDCYLIFRRRITFDTIPAAPQMRLSTAGQYQLSVNGQVLPGGQYHDFPERPTWTAFDLKDKLADGENIIEVLVHQPGFSFFPQPQGPDGLWGELLDGDTILDTTSEEWEAAMAPGYISCLATQLTSQLGYVFLYDARDDQPAWQSAVIVDRQCNAPVQRPVAPLVEFPAPEVTVVQGGFLIRPQLPEDATFAQKIAADFLRPVMPGPQLLNPATLDSQKKDCDNVPMQPTLRQENASDMPMHFPPLSDGANGWYLIADLGEETTGLLTFTLKAQEGCIIDIGHGEHLDDGRVRVRIASRNFADRYICRQGLNSFTHRLRRYGAKYIEMHFTGCSEPPQIGYVGLIPQYRDLPEASVFQCEDSALVKLDKVGIHTMKCCQHEHYEDCPWREQALYGYDSRNQALYGYYVWGNYEFAATCFRILGESYSPDNGYIGLIAPGKCHLQIPIFSLAWISELYDLKMHSGNLDECNLPVVRKILDGILERPVETPYGTIYFPGDDASTWNFCEWQPGLSGLKAKYQAPFNLYLVEALKNAAKLGAGEKYMEIAGKLGPVVEAFFWDEKRQAYRTTDEEDKLIHEHTQVMMLYNGLVPPERFDAVIAAIEAPATIKSTFSTLPYWLWTMQKLGGKYAGRIAPRLRQTFLPFVHSGATSLWETALGGNDFSMAGSLCHGWSSLPSYYFRAGILGVTPVEPGFTTFKVEPQPAGLTSAKGDIPTPYGNIHVEWELDKATGKPVVTVLSAPPQCKKQ